MSGKYALIIGNTEYIDPGLAQLTAPGKDAEDFARVLKDHEIGAFDSVRILLNQMSSTVNESIDEFFDQKKPDDLLVLYFSGHGVRDELGSLYLAVKNTIRSRLRSTAIKSDYIREVMDQSRSRRQVLILDCCNSGAVALGTKAATGVSIGTASAFEGGYGRIILTASDSTQFAWEGDNVIGETENSLFTHYLVEGLKGDADNDGDGRITVDELYDYAYEMVQRATPKQTPSKFSSKQQGEIVLRERMRLQDIKPVTLPDQLISEIENPYPEVRLRALGQLEKLLMGRNLGLALSAREALERIEKEDDSRRVAQAATQVLGSFRQAEQKAEEERRAREEEERLAQARIEAERLAEEQRLVAEKLEAERKAKEEAQHQAAQDAKESHSRTAELRREKNEQAERFKIEQDKLLKEKAELEERLREERAAREKIETEQLDRRKIEEERWGAPKAQEASAVKVEAEQVVREKTPDIVKVEISQPGQQVQQISTTEIKLFSIWKFGMQQVWQSLIGTVAYLVISGFDVFYEKGLGVAVIIFFGVAFGPWVGLITGLLGQIIINVFR